MEHFVRFATTLNQNLILFGKKISHSRNFGRHRRFILIKFLKNKDLKSKRPKDQKYFHNQEGFTWCYTASTFFL